MQKSMPYIKFMPLSKGTTNEEIVEYMDCHTEEGIFLIYLRCKYKCDKEWEYIIDACCLEGSNDILWLHDWWEGQEDVEYLGITQILYN